MYGSSEYPDETGMTQTVEVTQSYLPDEEEGTNDYTTASNFQIISMRQAKHNKDQSSFIEGGTPQSYGSKSRETGKSSSSGSWYSASTNSRSTDHYANEAYQKSSMGRIVLNQRLYYITSLLLNGLILSFYSVMAFTPHYPCLTATGSNITKGFEFAFKVGFFVHAVDFLNTGIFDFVIRNRTFKEMQTRGMVLNFTVMLETTYLVLEWTFRGAVLLVSIFQIMIRQSTSGQYCIHKTKVLHMEGTWLLCLLLVQVFKLGLLTVWHLTITRQKHGFFESKFEKSFDYSIANTTLHDRSHLSNTYCNDTTQNLTQSKIMEKSRALNYSAMREERRKRNNSRIQAQIKKVKMTAKSNLRERTKSRRKEVVSTRRHKHQYTDVTGDESALEKQRDKFDQTDYTANEEEDVSEDDQSCLLAKQKYADSIDVSDVDVSAATNDHKPRYLKGSQHASQASHSNPKSSKKSNGRTMTFHGSNDDSHYPVRDYLDQDGESCSEHQESRNYRKKNQRRGDEESLYTNTYDYKDRESDYDSETTFNESSRCVSRTHGKDTIEYSHNDTTFDSSYQPAPIKMKTKRTLHGSQTTTTADSRRKKKSSRK